MKKQPSLTSLMRQAYLIISDIAEHGVRTHTKRHKCVQAVLHHLYCADLRLKQYSRQVGHGLRRRKQS